MKDKKDGNMRSCDGMSKFRVMLALSIVLAAVSVIFAILSEYSQSVPEQGFPGEDDGYYQAGNGAIGSSSLGLVHSGGGTVFDADRNIALDYFRPAFTWSSGSEYDATRELYLDSMSPNSPFLSVFLPPNANSQGGGANYNYIDMNSLNCRLSGFEPYLLFDSGSSRTYLAVVKIEFMARVGQRSAISSSRVFVMYSIGGEGRIYGANGWIEEYSVN